MARIGLPVPPGLIVTTEACNAYLKPGGTFPDGMWEQELSVLQAIVSSVGKKR
jgi:pyruvate,orthophosphate dikinase